MTDHLDDDVLVLHATGDADDAAAVAAHLEACPACRDRAHEISRVIAAARTIDVPEPDAAFEARTWRAVEPHLPATRTGARPALWMGLAASLLLAFLLGREFPRVTPAPPGSAGGPPGTLAEAARERILLSAVGQHLERSQRVLVTASHADESRDLQPARAVAADLVRDNRLYRQTAARSGEAGLADVLDELERLLVELSRAPEDASRSDVRALRERVDDVLFKVRVLEKRLQSRETRPVGRVRPAIS